MRSEYRHGSLAIMRNWLVDLFKDEDVFLVGGGPSLKGFNLSRLKNKRTVAINHSYMYVPDADVLVFLDAAFKGQFQKRGHKFEDYDFKILCGPSSTMQPTARVLVCQYDNKAFSRNPGKLFGRISSTLFALNAMFFTGYRNLYLLGVDCRFHKGIGHYYSDKWKHPNDHNEAAYNRMIRHFNRFAHMKNVWNCSKTSAVRVFPYKYIGDAL